MKKPFFLLGLAASLCWIACDKGNDQTIIKGIVIDAKTSLPILEANLSCEIVDGTTHLPIDYINIQTGVAGTFSFESREDYGLSNFLIQKEGYYVKGGFGDHAYDPSAQSYTFKMHPRDAILRLQIQNLSGQHDTLLLGVYSPLYSSENGLSQGGQLVSAGEDLIALGPGQTQMADFSVSKGEEIHLFWSFDPKHRYYLRTKAPNRDTISLNPQDTSTYILTY